jgi:hypothetical protein
LELEILGSFPVIEHLEKAQIPSYPSAFQWFSFEQELALLKTHRGYSR